jgi:hypothetical protein
VCSTQFAQETATASGLGSVAETERLSCEARNYITWKKRDDSIVSLERKFHKAYDCKGKVAGGGESLVVSLKRFGAKKNWLAVSRQP